MKWNRELHEWTRITRGILEVRGFRMGIKQFFMTNERGKLV
jgi:hypothetical protein